MLGQVQPFVLDRGMGDSCCGQIVRKCSTVFLDDYFWSEYGGTGPEAEPRLILARDPGPHMSRSPALVVSPFIQGLGLSGHKVAVATEADVATQYDGRVK